MEQKKNPRARLENYSRIFTEIGLVLALFIIYALLESKTYEKDIATLAEAEVSRDVEEEIPIMQPKEILPEQPKPREIMPQRLEVVKDEQKIEEIVFESTETDETEAVERVEVEDIVEEEVAEEIVEDVPFVVIEKVPVYPGCTGNQKQLKDCFSKSLTKFFQKKFDPELATELGLQPGKKRIFVMFKIDRNGNVAGVQARAPHPRLKQEATKIINSLPKMKPGEQRGRAVGVRYTLPITFQVE